MMKKDSKQRLFEVMERLDKTFKPNFIHVAKSGRKYAKIPDDIDVDTWDKMTVPERMEYIGILDPNEKPLFPSGEKLDEDTEISGTTKTSEKKGFHVNIEKETVDNTNFRKVLYTGEHLQLVVMSLKPGEEIGMETHNDTDQFFRFDAGTGKAIINGNEYEIIDGDSIIVPAGSEHNVINNGEEDLKMYTIYTPPHHKEGTLFTTKEEAEENSEDFDGKTTE